MTSAIIRWIVNLCMTGLDHVLQSSTSTTNLVREGIGQNMDKLPDELLLHILTYLDLLDLVRTQQTSSRLLRLSRDNNVWRTICFTHSRAENQRRRKELYAAQDAEIVALRHAVNGWSERPEDVEDTARTSQGTEALDSARTRAMANWEPAYQWEKLDYYQEYIHRHAPIAPIGWLDLPSQQNPKSKTGHEATGIGILSEPGNDRVEKAVAPLDDGSICIWDMRNRYTHRGRQRGLPLGRSRAGLLSGSDSSSSKTKAMDESKAIMTETGAVECVSVDSGTNRGYFAVQNELHEIDLATLQAVAKETWPFPVTALSATGPHNPLTVGTTSTVHIYDPRNKSAFLTQDDSIRCELIGGAVISHAVLAQPGPLSILNRSDDQADSHSIWVAGRFTHLLEYDRRCFPRLRGTIHSGARISCLTSLPHPHIPRYLDLVQNPSVSINDLETAKSANGVTLLAAGVYKGKGSLELYGLSSNASTTSTITPSQPSSSYQNRQTASASKLLSVAYHGASIVYSDGDGNLKWVERNGSSHIRSYNINEIQLEPSFNQAQSHVQQDASQYGVFASTASQVPGQGDIVQKIIPITTSHYIDGGMNSEHGRPDINAEDLLLWTGDGRIGVLGFGHEDKVAREKLHVKALNAEERALEDAERQYSGTLRRALESQADEARFMRGLGLGYQQHW